MVRAAVVCHLFLMFLMRNWGTFLGHRFFVNVYSSIDSPFNIAALRLIPIVIDFVVKKSYEHLLKELGSCTAGTAMKTTPVHSSVLRVATSSGNEKS